MADAITHGVPRPEAELRAGAFDFVDFGCSEGRSIELAKFLFKGERGLGIDMDAAKVAAARAANFDAMQADITKLDTFAGAVRFVIAHHFLEHLADVSQAEGCIRSACTLARDFVFVKQPYFDADPYLLSHRLKFYWSDWACHPNHMTALDFVRVLTRLKQQGLVARFILYAVSPVPTSADPTIHPVQSKPEQQHWEAGRHPPKPNIALVNVYREIAALVLLRDGLDEIIQRAPKTVKLFDSTEVP